MSPQLNVPARVDDVSIPVMPVLRPGDADLDKLAGMIADAKTVAIMGGDGCRDARTEVLALAEKVRAPVAYSFRGKQWLEHDNPFAVGMTGLLGYGGAYESPSTMPSFCSCWEPIFPSSEFLPQEGVKKVQIDWQAKAYWPAHPCGSASGGRCESDACRVAAKGECED